MDEQHIDLNELAQAERLSEAGIEASKYQVETTPEILMVQQHRRVSDEVNEKRVDWELTRMAVSKMRETGGFTPPTQAELYEAMEAVVEAATRASDIAERMLLLEVEETFVGGEGSDANFAASAIADFLKSIYWRSHIDSRHCPSIDPEDDAGGFREVEKQICDEIGYTAASDAVAALDIDDPAQRAQMHTAVTNRYADERLRLLCERMPAIPTPPDWDDPQVNLTEEEKANG